MIHFCIQSSIESGNHKTKYELYVKSRPNIYYPIKEIKETKDTKDTKETKEIREIKEIKEIKKI